MRIIKEILKNLYIIGSFIVLDVWLRYVTRKIGAYHLLEAEPNLFTACWAVLLSAVLIVITRKKIKRILYALLYGLCMVYAIVQYGAFLILGKFLYVSDFLFASEGSDYISYVLEFIDKKMILQIGILVLIGVLGILFMPERPKNRWLWGVGGIAIAVAGVLFVPKLYEDTSNVSKWDNFRNPAYEYEQFSNPCFDMELTGMYQFFVHDIQLQIQRKYEDHEEECIAIDAYFESKEEHEENSRTGMFRGKNVIIVMMESVDDWLITEEDTPTLSYMMKHAICFDEFYTPSYSNGYTFNTEFAFNTGVYPYSNGNVAYSLTDNDFSTSIANVFKDAGYSVHSFHEGNRTFYNRGSMHETFGYERYHSYREYKKEDISVQNDLFLTESEELYADLISGQPFCSYVITYTPHLPYTLEDELSIYALEQYPEYAQGEITEENILRAKTRVTDDMFCALLERLEQDGILDDTVIVAFADHYAYGMDDDEILQMLSEQEEHLILERTPAFVFSPELEESIHVDKVMQTTDLGPTVMNLFGLSVPKEIMGSDIFDENYDGYAIFSGDTWLTNKAYMKEGSIVWNHGMSEEEIQKMNAFVQKAHEINDSILDADYFRYLTQK